MSSSSKDALIIGRGSASLGATLGLGRRLPSAVVSNSGVYQNALVKHVYMVPTWDHRQPAEYRNAATKEIVITYDRI